MINPARILARNTHYTQPGRDWEIAIGPITSAGTMLSMQAWNAAIAEAIS